jgi:PEP-CTERM motif
MLNVRLLFLAFCTYFIMIGSANANVVTYDITGSNNCYPFACGPMNYQQVYSSSQFGTTTVGITGLSFRAAQDGTGQAFGPTTLALTIDLSTSSVTPSTITGNFSTNRGADDLTVFSGNAVISSSGGNVFDIFIPFTNPFTYNPTLGNLMVGLNTFTDHPNVGQFDAGTSTLVGRNFGNTTSNYGLATEFQTTNDRVTNAPEPTTIALIAMGLFGFAAVGRKKNQA